MNLWAIEIYRKKHNKNILKAKVIDTETMQMKWLNSEALYNVILGGNSINNIKIEKDKVVLCNYIESKNKKIKRHFHYRTSENIINEHYVIALNGYKGIYEFLVNHPYNEGAYFLFSGTADDLDNYLYTKGIDWDACSIYNGYVSKSYWGNKKGRNKVYIYNNGTLEELVTSNINKNMLLRDNINCSWCDIEVNSKGLLGLDYIKFNQPVSILPEGVEYVKKQSGKTDCVVFPKSLKYLYDKLFYDSETILQITIQSQLDKIPDGFATDTPIQIFEYPPEFELNTIGKKAFYECNELKTGLICKVKRIEREAFYNTKIEKAVIPMCEYIGKYAFADCEKLKAVKLGENVEVRELAFTNCKNLHKINLEGVTHVGGAAFKNCSNIESVKLPNVKFIGKEAFKGCKKIKEVTINKDAKISSDAFDKDVIIYLE